MALIASFLLNAVANFALGLLLARYLGPAAFGLYAVAVAGAGAVASPALDWLRHAGTRFYSEGTRTNDPGVRATLDAGAGGISALLGVVALGCFWGLDAAHDGRVVGLAVLFCTLGALFDYASALMRARFMQRDYAVQVVLKNILTVAPMAAVAAFTGKPDLVLGAGVAGQALGLTVAWWRLRDPSLGWRHVRPILWRRYAAYGLPLMLAGGLAMVQAFYTRGAVASGYGLAEAGRFALAYDIGVRLVAVTAMALDVLLFQLAVRAEAQRGREAAREQLSRNLAAICALLAPVAVGYALILPGFETVFIAPEFRGAYATYTLALLPGLVAWALMQFGLSPAFQITGRTQPMALPHLLALAANVALSFMLPAWLGPVGYAVAFSMGMAAGLALAVILVARLAPITVPMRDLAAVACASAALAIAVVAASRVVPALAGNTAGALAGMVLLGGIAYAAVAFAANVAGIRDLVMSVLAGLRSPRRLA